MAVVRYASADAFLDASGRMLARGAAHAAAFRARVAAVRRPGDLERRHLPSEDGDALGMVAQRGNGPAAFAESDPPVARACPGDLYGVAPALPAGVGAFAACGAFIGARSRASGRSHPLRRHMRNRLVANLVLSVKPSREAQAGDDRYRRWWVSMQAALRAIARASALRITLGRDVALRAPAAGFRTREAGARVTHATIGFARDSALRITPVYTLTVHRGRGDAGALVAGIADEPLSARRRVFPATAAAKGTSDVVHASRGFLPFGDFYQFDVVAGP